MRQMDRTLVLPGGRPPVAPPLETPSLVKAIRKMFLAGFSAVGLFGAGVGVWGALAPLAAGAVAPGIISPDGSRRTVQHLEGGIIRTLKVRDGDEVKAGDPLVVLQSTLASATHDMLLEQARTLMATRARLEAEHIGAGSIQFPAELTEGRSRKLLEIVRGQRALFLKRHVSLETEMKILDDRTSQFEEQIHAVRAQVNSVETQMKLIEEEISAKDKLLKAGLVTKPEILRLLRTQAALVGERGEYLGSIAEIRQKIGELVTQRLSLEAERAEEVSAEMEEVRAQYADVSERLNASEDVLSRTVVTAPVSGRIANLRFKSEKGVILAGEPILDIVPTEEKLLIDAHVMPNDIDVVSIGLEATVHLTAYSSRGLPRVRGVVRTISADSVFDEASKQSYYLVRVEIAAEELATLDRDIVLVPGMPAEVLIVTGERTFLEYLLEPLQAAFRRGFRET